MARPKIEKRVCPNCGRITTKHWGGDHCSPRCLRRTLSGEKHIYDLQVAEGDKAVKEFVDEFPDGRYTIGSRGYRTGRAIKEATIHPEDPRSLEQFIDKHRLQFLKELMD